MSVFGILNVIGLIVAFSFYALAAGNLIKAWVGAPGDTVTFWQFARGYWSWIRNRPPNINPPLPAVRTLLFFSLMPCSSMAILNLHYLYHMSWTDLGAEYSLLWVGTHIMVGVAFNGLAFCAWLFKPTGGADEQAA